MQNTEDLYLEAEKQFLHDDCDDDGEEEKKEKKGEEDTPPPNNLHVVVLLTVLSLNIFIPEQEIDHQ